MMNIETDFFVICVITMAICMYGCYLMTQRYKMHSAFCLLGMLMLVGIGIFAVIVFVTIKNKESKNMNNNNMYGNMYQNQYYISPQYNHNKDAIKYEYKYCRKCGARIGMKSTFCPYCGDVFKK